MILQVIEQREQSTCGSSWQLLAVWPMHPPLPVAESGPLPVRWLHSSAGPTRPYPLPYSAWPRPPPSKAGYPVQTEEGQNQLNSRIGNLDGKVLKPTAPSCVQYKDNKKADWLNISPECEFLKIQTTITSCISMYKALHGNTNLYCLGAKFPLTCTVSSLCSNCSLAPMVLSTVPSLSWISSSQAHTPWRVSPKAWLSWQPRSFSLAALSRAWCSIWSWPVTLTSPPDPWPASDRDWASWQRFSMDSLETKR